MRPARYFSSSSCSSALRRRFFDLTSRSALGLGNGDCSNRDSGRCKWQEAVVDARQNSPQLRRLLLRRPLLRSGNPGTTEGGCAPRSPQRALRSTGKRQLRKPAWRAKLASSHEITTKEPKKGRRRAGLGGRICVDPSSSERQPSALATEKGADEGIAKQRK